MRKPEDLKRLFPGKVVLKSLARDNGFPRLPQYIVEFYIANMIDHSKDVQKNLSEARELLMKLFPTADTRQQIISLIVPGMDVIIVDRGKVKFDSKHQEMLIQFDNLGVEAIADQMMVRQLPRLLQDGLWGKYRLGCEQIRGDGKRYGYRIKVVEIEPYQIGRPDFSAFLKARENLNDAEWVDLLLASVGYEPSVLSAREKALMILRLVPAVEPNVNMLELGPRQTGKTYLLRNISSSVYTASGANVSAAELFVNLSSGQAGVLGTYQVVQFDEIAHTRFEDISVVSMLKDYMESGQYSRGGRTYASDTSILMAGNIDVTGNEPDARYQHLFEPLPKQLQDPAFLDRIHAYLPGWEINKLRYETISQGHGLVVDYIGQIFRELRNRDRRKEIHHLDIPQNLTRRDVVAVEKITSGLIKLIYPHDNYDLDQLAELANLALEMRWRVNNEMAKIAPGEFQVKTSKFTVPVPQIGKGPIKEQVKICSQQIKDCAQIKTSVEEAQKVYDAMYNAASLEVQRAMALWLQTNNRYLDVAKNNKEVYRQYMHHLGQLDLEDEDRQRVVWCVHLMHLHQAKWMKADLVRLELMRGHLQKLIKQHVTRGDLNTWKTAEQNGQ